MHICSNIFKLYINWVYSMCLYTIYNTIIRYRVSGLLKVDGKKENNSLDRFVNSGGTSNNNHFSYSNFITQLQGQTHMLYL